MLLKKRLQKVINFHGLAFDRKRFLPSKMLEMWNGSFLKHTREFTLQFQSISAKP
jgi:hypothetical protein